MKISNITIVIRDTGFSGDERFIATIPREHSYDGYEDFPIIVSSDTISGIFRELSLSLEAAEKYMDTLSEKES